MQHIRRGPLQVRRRRQLHDAAGPETRQHVEGQFRAAVVRLVDNHERPPQLQHIGQRAGHGLLRTLALGQQLGALGRRQMVEVVHQRAAGLIDLAALLVLYLKRLPGRNDDHGRGIQRQSRQASRSVEIQHRYRARLAQGQIVGMAEVPQCAQGLLANRFAGHQPEDDGMLCKF